MRVGFALSNAPDASSRKYAYMLDALQESVAGEVIPLYPLRIRWLERILHGINAISWGLFKRRVTPFHNRLMSVLQGRKLHTLVRQSNVDVVFAPFGASALAGLPQGTPAVYCSDATFARLIDYYPGYSHLWGFSRRSGMRLEQAALSRAQFSVFSSDWAAHSATTDYAVDPARVLAIPFGANLAEPPASTASRRELVPNETIQLLFLAVEWHRKGGDIALKVKRLLDERGLASQLTICGVRPRQTIRNERGVKVIESLDKNSEADRTRLTQLIANSHFLLLPVRAECMGHVFAEASAFGVPSITTDTGGVGAAVRNGENGFAVPFDEEGITYADAIEAVVRAGTYAQLSNSSRRLFENLLNWHKWAGSLSSVIEKRVVTHSATKHTGYTDHHRPRT